MGREKIRLSGSRMLWRTNRKLWFGDRCTSQKVVELRRNKVRGSNLESPRARHFYLDAAVTIPTPTETENLRAVADYSAVLNAP
jgi:hypothetical protein